MRNIFLICMIGFLAALACTPNSIEQNDQYPHVSEEEQKAVLEIHQSYLSGWLEMNEAKVLNLFEEEAVIQPSSLTPKKGKEEIATFWFPDDGSTTEIVDFNSSLLTLNKVDELLIATRSTFLDWNYSKDTLEFGMQQKGISTTIYRQQEDNSWKIWKKIWTDVEAVNK